LIFKVKGIEEMALRRARRTPRPPLSTCQDWKYRGLIAGPKFGAFADRTESNARLKLRQKSMELCLRRKEFDEAVSEKEGIREAVSEKEGIREAVSEKEEL
jgi:hypothetical protein